MHARLQSLQYVCQCYFFHNLPLIKMFFSGSCRSVNTCCKDSRNCLEAKQTYPPLECVRFVRIIPAFSASARACSHVVPDCMIILAIVLIRIKPAYNKDKTPITMPVRILYKSFFVVSEGIRAANHSVLRWCRIWHNSR